MSTVSGYPEIHYWQQDYLCAKTNISYTNYHKLCNVTFADKHSMNNLNYLFDMDSFGLYDPPACSLYNVSTLKTLLDVGERSVNIITNPKVTFEEAVYKTLDEWK